MNDPRNTDTTPPPPAELAALAAFEGALKREGEPRARLRHMQSHASATLRGVTLPPAKVMGVSLARK